jgi:hypothetical protein
MRANRSVRRVACVPSMTQQLLALIAALTALVPASADPALMKTAGFDLSRPEIRQFVDEVAARDQLSRKHLYAMLAKAEPQP